jgi:hypothetical protein
MGNDIDIEKLKEFKAQMEEFGANHSDSIKKEIFNKFFPTIADDEIQDYIFIAPDTMRIQLEESGIRHQDWMVFSVYADTVFAYDNTQTPFDEMDFKMEMENSYE